MRLILYGAIVAGILMTAIAIIANDARHRAFETSETLCWQRGGVAVQGMDGKPICVKELIP